MTQHISPVILSGGSGTRLWPLSTPGHPKQFHRLLGSQTMFATTLGRCADDRIFAPPIIVGGARHKALTATELETLGLVPHAQILEPCARNTAPAIALAALAAPSEESLLLVMPSDHVMTEVPAFLAAVSRAQPLAEQGWLVTFGITPDGPETGYGYIERGEALGSQLYAAKRFVEKPAKEAAEAMLAQGGYSWNAGIFLFRADVYLETLATYAPDMLAASRAAMKDAEHDEGTIKPSETKFGNCPSESIDYAVMEKAEHVAVAPVDPGWSDIGSWDALAELMPVDNDGNAKFGQAIISDASGNMIHSSGPRITLHGVNDLIIIANGDEVMILPRGSSQTVKQLAGKSKDADAASDNVSASTTDHSRASENLGHEPGQ